MVGNGVGGNVVTKGGGTDLDVKLQILVHLVDIGEDVADDSWNDALHLLTTKHSLHRMRLTGRRLPVREDCSVVATEYICNDDLMRYTYD